MAGIGHRRAQSAAGVRLGRAVALRSARAVGAGGGAVDRGARPGSLALGEQGSLPRQWLIGTVRVLALTQLYLFWHWLFSGLAPAASAALVPALVWVVVAFGALYGVQIWLRRYPDGRFARRFYPWAYNGFYLDETITRLTFKSAGEVQCRQARHPGQLGVGPARRITMNAPLQQPDLTDKTTLQGRPGVRRRQHRAGLAAGPADCRKPLLGSGRATLREGGGGPRPPGRVAPERHPRRLSARLAGRPDHRGRSGPRPWPSARPTGPWTAPWRHWANRLPELRPLPLLSDLFDRQRDLQRQPSWCDTITHQISQFCAAYFDRDQAQWHPQRQQDLYRSWRQVISQDHSIALLMRHDFRPGRADTLADDAEQQIADSLRQLAFPRRSGPTFYRRCCCASTAGRPGAPTSAGRPAWRAAMITAWSSCWPYG